VAENVIVLSRIKGAIDYFLADRVVGWCCYPDAPLVRAEIRVFDGLNDLGTVECDRFRDDLSADVGSGHFGFEFAISPFIREPRRLVISLQECRTGIWFARRIVPDPALDAKISRMEHILGEFDSELHRLMRDSVEG